MTTQIPLISAEVIESSRRPPPKREDWYIVLYVTSQKNWSTLKTRWGAKPTAIFCTVEVAREEALRYHLEDYRIVRIPGEGQ